MTAARTAEIPIQKFMRDQRLLGPSFAGDSWRTWEIVMKAAHAQPLTDAEVVAFRAVADRDPPTQRVKELVAIVGRGGGKDSVAALLATHAAVSFDPRGKLRPGEYAYVLCIACDRDQAALVHRYIKGNFEQTPALAKMVREETADSITLSNRVVIQVTTNSYRAVRGRSVLACIFDEVALFRSDDSANPDTELHAAVRPGLARVPGSMLILISTAYKRAGLLYQRFKDHYGKASDDILVVKGTTRDFNPKFDQAEIDKDLASDPARFAAEYLGEWRDDLSAFIDRALVEAATDTGVIVRPPQEGIRYTSFIDASGGRGDSFTCAIAHADQQTAVLDCLVEIRPPFNPDVATRDICTVLKSYGLRKTKGDRYGAEWVVAAFARNGITLVPSEDDRSALYLGALPLFTAGRVQLVDNAKMAAQFVNLERRTLPSGQDKVNHPPGGHDDLANAVAGALVAAVGGRRPLNVTNSMLVRARSPSSSASTRPQLTPLAARMRSRPQMKVFM